MNLLHQLAQLAQMAQSHGLQGFGEAQAPQPNMQQQVDPYGQTMQGLQNPGATPGQGGMGVGNVNMLQALGNGIGIPQRRPPQMNMMGGSPQGFPDQGLGDDYDGNIANSLMLGQPVSQQSLQPTARPRQIQGPQSRTGNITF